MATRKVLEAIDKHVQIALCSKALEISSRLNPQKFPLLSQRNVIRWMHYNWFDTKMDENAWGRQFSSAKIWTAAFGESIVSEIFKMKYTNVSHQFSVANHDSAQKHRLDLAIHGDSGELLKLVEVKTCMHNSGGNTHEKALAIPYKYASVPHMSGCNVDIVLVGGQETTARMRQSLLRTSPKELYDARCGKIKNVYEDAGFRFIGATELFHSAAQCLGIHHKYLAHEQLF